MPTCLVCGKEFTKRHGNHKVACGPRCRRLRNKAMSKVQRNPLGRPLRAGEQGPFDRGDVRETWQERWQRGLA